MPNFNGFLKLPPLLGGGYLRYQRSPSAHYGGTCLCDGWHVDTRDGDDLHDILLHATNVQRHSSKWDWAEAMLRPTGSTNEEGNVPFPWHLIKPIRLWTKHLQTRRRRLIAVKRGQTTHGLFVLIRGNHVHDNFAWEAALSSTGERLLTGNRRALIRAIESRKLNRGASLTLFAHWLSPKSDEWNYYRALYGG